jgi:hypothetical protein
MGVDGIWWAVPFAEVTTLFMSLGLFFRKRFFSLARGNSFRKLV